MSNILSLILMTIWVTICAACVIGGFFLGRKNGIRKDKNELSKEEELKLERDRRLLENFWSYNGDKQS